MTEDKKDKEKKRKLTEKDVEVLSKILENVTVTKSGMIRTSCFFVPNPKFDKEFSEGMRALQQLPELVKQMVSVMTKISKDVENLNQG